MLRSSNKYTDYTENKGTEYTDNSPEVDVKNVLNKEVNTWQMRN
jgi:hypothetical protein